MIVSAELIQMASIFGIGLRGILSGFQQVADASQRLSRAFSPAEEEDPVKSMIDLKQGERQVQASAKVIKVADELGQNTLDIIA